VVIGRIAESELIVAKTDFFLLNLWLYLATVLTCVHIETCILAVSGSQVMQMLPTTCTTLCEGWYSILD
jgi:hypothetical protein